MKRFSYFFLLLVFSSALFLTCASTHNLASSENTRSSVWKIERDGHTLYLGGSIHILRDDDFPLPIAYDRAYSSSSALVLEADIDQMEDDEVIDYLMSHMILPDYQTLDTVLDAETYEMLEAKASEYGLPLELVYNYKPSMVMMMLSGFQIQEFGFSQQGIDAYFLHKAEDEHKPLYFLEPVEAQIAMMVSMGEGYEDDYVRYSLYDMENTELFLDDLLEDWRTGRASSTEAAALEMQEEWPALYQSLFCDRHDEWMPQIERFLESDSTYFVVVGFAHIHGPDGLLQRLSERGYSIEQYAVQ